MHRHEKLAPESGVEFMAPITWSRLVRVWQHMPLPLPHPLRHRRGYAAEFTGPTGGDKELVVVAGMVDIVHSSGQNR